MGKKERMEGSRRIRVGKGRKGEGQEWKEREGDQNGQDTSVKRRDGKRENDEKGKGLRRKRSGGLGGKERSYVKKRRESKEKSGKEDNC